MQACPNCGQESRADDHYCMHCGHALGPQRAAGLAVLPVDHALVTGDAPDTRRAQSVPAADQWRPAGANGGAAPQAQTDPSVGRLLLQPSTEGEPPREYVLDGRNITIGRAPACTVSLSEDQLVSRLHAVLHFDADHYTISDLGSSNGTLVNGTMIQSVTPLADGDRITVGQHVLIFTQTPSHIATSSSAHEAAPAHAPPGPPSLPPSLPPMPDVPNWEALLAQDNATKGPESIDEASATGSSAQDAAEIVTVVDAHDLGGGPATRTANAAQTGEESAPPFSAAVHDQSAGDPPVATGPRTGQLEALRAQIVETSTVLAHWTETTAQNTKRLRAGLADVAGIVAAALVAATGDSSNASPQGPAAAQQRLDEVIQVAEQAANDPHHVDALVALAERSSEIATTLRIHQHLIDRLVELRDHLDALARQEGW